MHSSFLSGVIYSLLAVLLTDNVHPLASVQSLDNAILDLTSDTRPFIGHAAVQLDHASTGSSKVQCILTARDTTAADERDLALSVLVNSAEGSESQGFNDGSRETADLLDIVLVE
jgi:hypothetical protein